MPPGADPAPPNPTSPDTVPAAVVAPRVATGVNVAPGSDDDGWVVPPPVTLDDGSHLQLYKDGEALHAALDAIAAAKRRVCLEVYIFSGDDTGRRFADALMRKAREGVEVFVIYDDFGSMGTDRRLFRDLARAGVHTRVFHPVRPWECHFSWRPFNRDHRKLLVIDDEVGGLGGLNVGAEYAGSWVASAKKKVQAKVRLPSSPRSIYDHKSPEYPDLDDHLDALDYWRDNAVGVSGPSARILQRAFNNTWRYLSHGGRIARAMTLHPPPHAPPRTQRTSSSPIGDPRPFDARSFDVPREGNHLSLMATVPTLDSPLRPSLHRLFASARKSLRLTMAYFAPDDDLIAALCRAAQRGVKVQLMLPGVCDVPILVTAARFFYDTLLSAGVEIYERQSVVLHAKTMVVDERLSVIGSTNLDYRSIEYNLEVSAVITSEAFGQQMAALFENDIRYAIRIHRSKWKRRPWTDRLGQWAVSRARYLL